MYQLKKHMTETGYDKLEEQKYRTYRYRYRGYIENMYKKCAPAEEHHIQIIFEFCDVFSPLKNFGRTRVSRMTRQMHPSTHSPTAKMRDATKLKKCRHVHHIHHTLARATHDYFMHK